MSGVGGTERQRQQPVHSHCVLLDLVISYFTKITEEPKMQSSQQCSYGEGGSLGALSLSSQLTGKVS